MAHESTKIGAIFAFAGVVIASIISASMSFVEIRTQQIAKETELQSQELLKEKELALKRIEQAQDLRIERGDFIFGKMDSLLQEEQSATAKALLFWSLGEDDAKRLFSYINQFGSEKEKVLAAAVLETIVKRQDLESLWEGSWKLEIPDYDASGDMTSSMDEGLFLAQFDVASHNEGWRSVGQIRGFLNEEEAAITGTWVDHFGQYGSIRMTLKTKGGGEPMELEGRLNYHEGVRPPDEILRFTGLKNDSGRMASE